MRILKFKFIPKLLGSLFVIALMGSLFFSLASFTQTPKGTPEDSTRSIPKDEITLPRKRCSFFGINSECRSSNWGSLCDNNSDCNSGNDN